MYIDNIKIKNYGPIDDINIDATFNDDGSPRPIILMGKNGSGKTLLLSQIIQSILLYKSSEYNNIPEKDSDKLYKVLSSSYVKNNKVESYVSISFNNKKYSYTEIMSKNPDATIKNESAADFLLKVKNDSQFMDTGLYYESAGKLDYDKNVCLYFPVDRYYIPGWKNKDLKIKLGIENKVVGKTSRNILCNNVQNGFEEFILNTILDKYLYDNKEYIKVENSFIVDSKGNPIINYIGKNSSILDFINYIINEFKDDNYTSKRLFISKKETRRIGIIGKNKNNIEEEIIDSFNNLSTGEYSLLSMFTSILMDYNKIQDNNESFNFQNIKGIVLIDEAELNLHIDLQMNLLPSLMKKFKNIQFIITTQSPFLIYALNSLYSRKCDIYDMPNGYKVNNILDLSEVKASYDSMKKYNDSFANFVDDTKKEIESASDDLIVITEGKTDPIYLKTAQKKLKVLKNRKIRFIGLKTEDANKFEEEGCDALDKLARALSIVPQKTPVILLYDRDVSNNDILENKYIEFEKNIYKMCIPVPSHRTDSKDICIEHYFKDSEIKREDSDGRRLYMGNEFNKNGICFAGDLMCKAIEKCGESSIKILDGSGKTKVYRQDDDNNQKNLALSKIVFAENINNEVDNFNDFDFSEFNKIFVLFEEILNKGNI